ncbi:MAG: hypothetical protein E5Y09_29910 [Mesorhizobium sp.]|nr:MAG: hypothetical protein E5Y09_29910 [Mesorhizobium sp.]
MTTTSDRYRQTIAAAKLQCSSCRTFLQAPALAALIRRPGKGGAP